MAGPKTSVAIFGCGAVGSALATRLAGVGTPLRLWSRTPARAQELGERLGPGAVAEADLEAALAGVEAALICVTDDAIAACASAAAVAGPAGGAVALHTSGGAEVDRLAPLAEAGWSCGRLHPLVALPPAGAPEVVARALDGAWYAISGDDAARALAATLAERLGGKSFALETNATLYHAAATLLAGGLVGLFDGACAALREAGLDEETATGALRGLLRSVAANLDASDATAALTGAAARGSVEGVDRHLEAFAAFDPQLAELYRLLARRGVAMAEERGTIDAAQRAALLARLDRPDSSG